MASKKEMHNVLRWCKPEPRQVKLNVDASFLADICAGSAGAVLRDYHGNFIAGSCVFLPHVSTAEMAEALAMREGLSLANSVGCSAIIAEYDSMETIEACSGDEIWWNDSAAIFADCIDLVSAIGVVTFKHCPREANQVAHELARTSFCNNSTCRWLDDPPSFILGKLINDVTVVDI